MAFEQEQERVPASIGDISVVLTDYISTEETDSVGYEVQVLQADGSMFRLVSGNLAPHLTAGQISALQAFMADMRVKATAEILGE